VNSQSLEQHYASKTNDELLALSIDDESLRQDAKLILIQELRRRGLDPALKIDDLAETSSISPKRHSSLRSLRSPAIFVLNVVVAVLGTKVLEAEIGGAILPRSIAGLLWKWWSLDLFCAALLGFLMWKAWNMEVSKWTWTLPAIWFGLGILFALFSRQHQSVIVGDGFCSHFSGADCVNGWRPGSGCADFFAFTEPFIRGISFSLAAYIASKVRNSRTRVADRAK
jgi:hypothetical protein